MKIVNTEEEIFHNFQMARKISMEFSGNVPYDDIHCLK